MPGRTPITSMMAVDAEAIGLLARDAIPRSMSAMVLARFERSFCLKIGKELITIGERDLHNGPLNVRLAANSDDALASALAVELGQYWAVSPNRLRRPDGLSIDLSKADVWRPELPTAKPDAAMLSEGIEQLRGHLARLDLAERGLLRIILEGPVATTATERAAKPYIEILKVELPNWLEGEDTDPSAAVGLLGLGPGLTPSGDDLLAGLMIASRCLGAADAVNRLGPILRTEASTRTTSISLAHLDAAARGYGAAPLHHLLAALINGHGAAIAEALDATVKIGHSSGLDAIAGVILALNAWLEVEGRASTAA